MVPVFEFQIAEIFKRLLSDSRLEGTKLSNEMKKFLENFNINVHYEVANCMAMLCNRLTELREVDVSAAVALDTSPVGKAVLPVHRLKVRHTKSRQLCKFDLRHAVVVCF